MVRFRPCPECLPARVCMRQYLLSLIRRSSSANSFFFCRMRVSIATRNSIKTIYNAAPESRSPPLFTIPFNNIRHSPLAPHCYPEIRENTSGARSLSSKRCPQGQPALGSIREAKNYRWGWLYAIPVSILRLGNWRREPVNRAKLPGQATSSGERQPASPVHFRSKTHPGAEVCLN